MVMPRHICPSSGPNAVLIQRAINGDGAAFLELTGRYEGLIRHIGFQEFHLAGADLQDLVQDIFLLLLRDARALPADAKP
jgi:DNA-directed RNA polymerase specialized sigma24 family protein